MVVMAMNENGWGSNHVITTAILTFLESHTPVPKEAPSMSQWNVAGGKQLDVLLTLCFIPHIFQSII